MDLKVNSGPPPSPHKLSHHAPPPPCSLASSFPAYLQAPSPAQALGDPSLNLASDSTDLPAKEDLASHSLCAPPTPAPAESRFPGPGPLLRGLRARPGRRGGREAQGGRVVAPRQPPGPPRSPGPAPLPQQMPSPGELYLKNPGGHYGILQTVTVSVWIFLAVFVVSVFIFMFSTVRVPIPS